MATEYRDPTPIPENPNYDPKDVPEVIKTNTDFVRDKMKGKDVREALGRAVDIAGIWSFKVYDEWLVSGQVADRSLKPIKLKEDAQNAGLTSGVYYPMAKATIINNELEDSASLNDHLTVPLQITVDNADPDKTYLLLQIFNDSEKNLYGATFGYVPRSDEHLINATDVKSYNFSQFSTTPLVSDQYGHITQKYVFSDDTAITITYQDVDNLRLYFGDINLKKYYDSCVIDESCYRYRLDSRGLNRNLNVEYPLVNFKVPDNGLKNSEPLPAHKKVLRDIKVINPDPDLSYLIAGIYDDDEFNRYGVQFATAKKLDGNSFNKDDIEVVNKLETLPATKLVADNEGNITFTCKHNATTLMATYNLLDLEELNSPRLLYFKGNNFYDIALISEAANIIFPVDADLKKYNKPTWLGDSITEINNKASIHYHEIIAQKWGATTSTNMGISGSTIGNKSNPMSVRYKDIPVDTDFISVFGGVNDYGKNQPLGEFGDTTNETFYGALHVLFDGLQSKFPTVPKIFISPMKIGSDFGGDFNAIKNGLGLTQMQYERAIVEMTQLYSIPHLSLLDDMGVTFAVKAQGDYYSADTLHPNNAGHEIIADKILEFLK